MLAEQDIVCVETAWLCAAAVKASHGVPYGKPAVRSNPAFLHLLREGWDWKALGL